MVRAKPPPSAPRAAATIVAPFGITVNAVCPGHVDAPMKAPAEATMATLSALHVGAQQKAALAQVPLGRVASPDDIAGVVAFLASRDGS